MKKVLNIILISSLCLFMGAASHNSFNDSDHLLDDDRNTTEEFKVKSGQKLELDFQTGAGISVTGWDKEIIIVKASIEGRDADEVIVILAEPIVSILWKG